MFTSSKIEELHSAELFDLNSTGLTVRGRRRREAPPEKPEAQQKMLERLKNGGGLDLFEPFVGITKDKRYRGHYTHKGSHGNYRVTDLELDQVILEVSPTDGGSALVFISSLEGTISHKVTNVGQSYERIVQALHAGKRKAGR